MTAQAAGCTVENFAKTTYGLKSAMGLKANQVQSGFCRVGGAGKGGMFQPKDSAQYLPAFLIVHFALTLDVHDARSEQSSQMYGSDLYRR